jgi:hypothetical protein
VMGGRTSNKRRATWNSSEGPWALLGGFVFAVSAGLLLYFVFLQLRVNNDLVCTAHFLALPMLGVVAYRLSPTWAWALVGSWCLLTTISALYGHGPCLLGGANQAIHLPELVIYQAVIAAGIHFVSSASSRLQQQFKLSEIALSAAGIELWEWDKRRGFTGVRGLSAGGYLRDVMVDLEDREALVRLQGGDQAADTWNERIQNKQASARTLLSTGRILKRGKDRRPTQAIGLLQDISASDRAETAQIQLTAKKAKLQNLQAKLNPHFLFNSLNVIRALVHIDQKKADEAIGSLASLMRSRLTASDSELIDLGEELVHIRELLHLARLRFGKRVRSRVRVGRDLLKTPVPPMMLLNLVENAITHGIANLEQGGMIHITGKAVDDQVYLSIRSSGTLAQDCKDGIGTREARQRLELLFGQRASFAISQLDAENVIVEIYLPKSNLTDDTLDL